jgi:hypothetical protein
MLVLLVAMSLLFTFSSVSVYASTIPKLPTPTMKPSVTIKPQKYPVPKNHSFAIEVYSPISDATLLYTTDGTDPNTHGKIYTKPISMTDLINRFHHPLRVLAKKDGYQNSDEFIQTFFQIAARIPPKDAKDLQVKLSAPKIGAKSLTGTVELEKGIRYHEFVKVQIHSLSKNDKQSLYDSYTATVTAQGKWSLKLKRPIRKKTTIVVSGDSSDYWAELQREKTQGYVVYSTGNPIWETIVRQVSPDTNAFLKSIKLSSGKFSLRFRKNRTWYRARISSSKKAVTIRPNKQSVMAKVQIKVGEKGIYRTYNSIKVKLRRGQSRNVFIRVTAQDGKHRKVYVVNVTRRR